MSYTTTEKSSNTIVVEDKLQTYFKNSKEFFLKVYNICLPYWNAVSSTFEMLWQYSEFRLCLYIFGILSLIPTVLFLLVISFVIISTTILVSFIWTFLVLTALTIGLIILIPILIGCFIVSGFLVVGYDIYQYLLQSKPTKQQQ